jgi:hypothetical protein
MQFLKLAAIVALALSFAQSASAATIGLPANYLTLSSGLVGYWTFDGADTTDKIYDRSGQRNNGYFESSAAATSSMKTIGKLGQALVFSGVSKTGVAIPSITTGTTFTYSAWMYSTGADGGNHYGNLFIGGSSQGIWYVMSIRKISYYYGNADHLNNTARSINKWHHVVVVNNAGTATFYIDGVADGTAVSAVSFNADGMGCDNIAIGTECLIGKLDDVRIYNRALSPTEVQALYNIGAANIAHSNTTALSSGLVGYWTFDGGATHWNTGKVDDVSGHGNTGQLINMSTTTSPTPGKIGQALTFINPSNDYQFLDIANESNFNFTGNFSISLWIKPDVTLAGYHGVVGKFICAVANSGWDLGIYDGFMRMTLRGSVNIDNSGVGNDLRDGKWHHVVVINTPSSIQTYEDGVSVDTTNGTWTATTNTKSRYPRPTCDVAASL